MGSMGLRWGGSKPVGGVGAARGHEHGTGGNPGQQWHREGDSGSMESSQVRWVTDEWVVVMGVA